MSLRFCFLLAATVTCIRSEDEGVANDGEAVLEHHLTATSPVDGDKAAVDKTQGKEFSPSVGSSIDTEVTVTRKWIEVLKSNASDSPNCSAWEIEDRSAEVDETLLKDLLFMSTQAYGGGPRPYDKPEMYHSLSLDAYTQFRGYSLKSPGWQLERRFPRQGSMGRHDPGVHFLVFRNRCSKKIVIAIRGTDFETPDRIKSKLDLSEIVFNEESANIAAPLSDACSGMLQVGGSDGVGAKKIPYPTWQVVQRKLLIRGGNTVTWTEAGCTEELRNLARMVDADFHAYYAVVAAAASDYFEEIYQEESAYTLITTGHSLGGQTAHLTALAIQKSLSMGNQKLRHFIGRVSSHSFAAPSADVLARERRLDDPDNIKEVISVTYSSSYDPVMFDRFIKRPVREGEPIDVPFVRRSSQKVCPVQFNTKPADGSTCTCSETDKGSGECFASVHMVGVYLQNWDNRTRLDCVAGLNAGNESLRSVGNMCKKVARQ